MRWLVPFLCLPLLLAVSEVEADEIHLRGGAVIEGKATAQGDKLLIELDAGRISVPLADVVRVDSKATPLERFDTQFAALDPNDVRGHMKLAAFCREHGLVARERELLTRVIELEPDHAEARSRLGYVRTERGWRTEEERMRDAGLVRHGNRWLTPEALATEEQRAAELETAKLERDRARIELQLSERRLVAQERSERQAPAREATDATSDAARASGVLFPLPLWPGPFGVYPGHGCGALPCLAPPRPGPEPSFINGAHDPRNTTFSLPGVRDPRLR